LIAAACAGIVGIGLIFLSPAARLDLIGVIAALAATIMWACGTVLTRHWRQPAPLLVFTAWQLVAGGLILLPIAFVVEGMPPALSMRNVAGFAYLGVIGTGLAYALWFRGIERLGASTVAFLTLLSAVSALVLDVTLLNHTMTIIQTFGVMLVLVSIVAAQLMNKKSTIVTL